MWIILANYSARRLIIGNSNFGTPLVESPKAYRDQPYHVEMKHQNVFPTACVSTTQCNDMTLTWESTYAIAMELRRQYNDVNIEEVTLQQILDWTLQLPEFEDDPALVNDDILYAIYQDWFEENIHG
jgi:FeS assembly protein IscX